MNRVPGVTVVIPNWNRRGLLVKLLESIRAQTHSVEDVIVVDNGSSDGSAEVATAAGARVIRLKENCGFAKAVNLGIAESTTTLIAVLNNDVELAPDWLSRLAASVEEPETWFATGRIFSAVRDGLIDGTYDLPAKAGCAWRGGNGRRDSAEWRIGRAIRFAPFTAALFRAELFSHVGPLDERFGSYLEDIDFCLRAALKGYEGRYVAEAVAWHYGSATLGPWSAAMVRLVSRNQVLFIALHYPASLIVKYAWCILVGHVLWGALAFRNRAGVAWLKGKWEGLRLCRRIRASRSPAAGEQLARILSESELEIYELQKKTGFDWFWRVYFALT